MVINMYLNSEEMLTNSSKRLIVVVCVVIILLTQEKHVNKDEETVNNTTITSDTLRLLSFRHDARTVRTYAYGNRSSVPDKSLIWGIFLENTKKHYFPVFKTTDVKMSWKHGKIQWKNLITLILIFAFLEKIGIFRKCPRSYAKVPEKENLFRFTHFTRLNHFTVCPSLNQYFNDAVKGTKESFMNYEWVRYETFKTFPDKSVVTPMRLAKAGFYYTGEGEETICFSCGLKNKEWNEREAVIDTHKRLASNCHFVNGTDKTNVPIHVNEPETNITTSSPSHGACGNSDDINTTVESHRPCFNKEQVTNDGDLNNTYTTTQQVPITSNLDINQCRNIDRFPGIFRETPKYPDYAIKSKRLASFEEQTNHHPISSTDLAEAGFFRAGSNDEVRCFFCGEGMRSWQRGDNPWIEHARWFPNCAYVRQFKGDDFVNMCRASNLINTDIYNEVAQFRNEPFETCDVSDRLVEDLNSAAARSVLDMGYTQEQVEEAIKHVHHRHGATEIRPQHLLEYLLDNTYIPPQTETVRKKVPTADKTQKQSVPMTCDTSNTLTPGDKDKNKLEEENERLKEKMLCKICFDMDASIVFMPCGHMVACVECSHALRKCAVCRKLIEGRIKTYLS